MKSNKLDCEKEANQLNALSADKTIIHLAVPSKIEDAAYYLLEYKKLINRKPNNIQQVADRNRDYKVIKLRKEINETTGIISLYAAD